MIRSGRIPPVLNRICDAENTKQPSLHSALLVTTDGELMGCSTGSRIRDVSALATLLADVGVDYMRLGEELASSSPRSSSNNSHLQCLLMEFEQGIVGIASCGGMDCLVMAIADPGAPLGLLRGRLEALSGYVQESFLSLVEPG